MSLAELKNEINSCVIPPKFLGIYTNYLIGFNKNPEQSNVLRRADAIAEVFTKHKKHVYKNDKILGSIMGIYCDKSEFNPQAEEIFYSQIKSRYFANCFDHYAPNYRKFLKDGVNGTINNIKDSLEQHKNDRDRVDFLNATLKVTKALSQVLLEYADVAEKMGKTEEATVCRNVATNAPSTFKEALQLVVMVHILFYYEDRFAMAFGRMDQYLYPYYRADKEAGKITDEEACDLLGCSFYKLAEFRRLRGGDDVCNIAIGGVKPQDGSDATNELSYLILQAVNNCHIPGPNLSAKIHKNTPQEFVDECLKVIGTGLGYPALMNDDVNIASLYRYGVYSLEDCRDYCMVGCIENFIQGKQPPWSDDRYNSPKYIEYALNDGIDPLNGRQVSIQVAKAEDIKSMDEFIDVLVKHMEFGAKCYIDQIHKVNDVDAVNLQQPFLSIFCDDCIQRGLDINMGGAIYPPAHGVAVMGLGTFADSLAAIEKLVFVDKVMTLAEMRDILNANFVGHEKARKMMLDCPKYGNNDDFADKWAVWFVDKHAEIFDKYRTFNGGPVYIDVASNTDNIPAGREIGATPDGRLAREELSDAASPTHGVDVNGPTATFLSLSKPDFTKSATGSVVNQKYPPIMFSDDEKRKKLGALIRVYFNRGGQEVQINSVSREILKDAMVNPQKYASMVVRVSGFSAYYTELGEDVQLDILKRTEHESI